MTYTDKQLKCVECGTDFTHSAQDQERFAQLGYENEPRRCEGCRAARRARQGGGGGGGQRQDGNRQRRELFDAICAECNRPAKIPFKPRGDRPIYCSTCFEDRRHNG